MSLTEIILSLQSAETGLNHGLVCPATTLSVTNQLLTDACIKRFTPLPLPWKQQQSNELHDLTMTFP